MEERRTYKLGDLLTIKYGKDHKSLSDGPYAAYGSGGIMRYVEKPIYDKASILIPRKGSLNNVLYVDKPFWTVDTMFWTIIDTTIVIPHFLFYAIRDIDFANLNVGSAVPSLTCPVIEAIEVQIPSIEKQKRILDCLEPIDEKIELNNRINHNLEQQAQTLFKSWFVDFEPFKDGKFVDSEIGLIPEGWNVQPLSTILEYSKKSINPQKYPETIFTHYSLPAYDNSKEPEVQKGYEIMSNKFVVEENMILFSKLNPRIKRIWYIDDIPANSICSTEFIAYKALDTNAYPFCWCYLNSDMFYDKIMSSVNGATGSHQRFHAEETLDICFPYNKDAIQSFSTLIKPMLGSIVKNEAEIRVLKNERDFLLPQLMNGKMKVNN